MSCIVCGRFSRTRGSPVACACIANKPLHCCCAKRLIKQDYRCLECNSTMYRDSESWTDAAMRWEETLISHVALGAVDFAWMVFMYVGYNMPSYVALPMWGLYYIMQVKRLKMVKHPWGKIATLCWILFYPVLNGLVVDAVAPRWASYAQMAGSDILADLLPLLFFTLCIERGKQALLWMALPRPALEQKSEKRAFLGAAGMWWDTAAAKAALFGAAFFLYFFHVFFVRHAMRNVLLLPFYCGFVFLAANVGKPRLIANVVY